MTSLGTLSFDTKLNAQAVKDAETIKKQVLHKLGNSVPLKLKVTFTSKDLRSDLQSQLSKFKPKVKVDIVVDQATASQAVQQALAKAGLMNNATAGQLRAQRMAYIQQKMALDLERAQRQAAAAADRHSKSLLTLNSHFGNGISLGGKFSTTVASIYSVYTLKNFLQNMIEIGGEFQKQRIALETMLGSLSKADVMYRRMKELAIESPFTFMDLMSYTKQLKAFQIPYNELFETTKRLGDISAGLGVDMNRLILAFGQVRAAAFLRGQEVRQFTEAGIPLIDALAKKLSELEKRYVSVGDVFDRISKRQIDFSMVKDVLWELTDEGGQFYNMQAKLTESLSGKLDKLKDSYQIMVAEMAQGNNAALGKMLDIMTGLISHGDTFISILASLTAGFVAYKVAIIAWNMWVNRAIISQQILNALMNANYMAITIGAIATAISLYATLTNSQDENAKSIRELRAEIQEEVEKMDEAESKGQELIRTMFNETKARATQIEAYKRLQALYPEMFKNMDFEQAKRKTNIELLQMETQAAREAMKAKIEERIKDAQSRKAKLGAEYKNYNINSEKDLELTKDILRKGGGEEAVQKFEKLVQQYNSVNEELDELNKVQEEIKKRVETASKNRSAKWWNKAKELAGDLTMYAPKEDQDFEDYFESIEKSLNSRKGLLDKMTEKAENYDLVKKDVTTLQNIFENALGGKTEALSKFKPKSNDPLLDSYKTRLDSLEKFMQAYERYANEYTKEDAINLAENLFPDFKGKGKEIVDNYRDLLLELSKISGNDNRKKFSNSVSNKISEIDTKEAKKKIDNAMKELDKYIESQSNKYDLYKKILDATGNRTQAATIAFGTNISFDNFAEELRNKIQEKLPSLEKAKGISIDKLLLKDDEGLKELGIFEKGIDGVYKMLKKLREEEQKLKAEDVDLFIQALENAKSLESELALIDIKYERARKAISERGGEQTQTLIENTYKNQNSEKAKAQWEWFKKTNEDWGRIFSDLNKVSTMTLQNMLDKLKEQLPLINDNVEAVKALYEAMERIQAQLNERNPFEALAQSISKAATLRSLLSGYTQKDAKEVVYIDKDTRKKLGLGDDKKTATVSELFDMLRESGDTFEKAIGGIGSAFKALQDVLSPVIDLFDQLGMTSISDFFNVGNNALGAAASAASGINAMKGLFKEGSGLSNLLGAAGPYGAAAAAGLSIVSSLFAMHDKALQEEIDASKARQKEMENLTKNLESVLEHTLSGIYKAKASDSDIMQLRMETLNRSSLLFANGSKYKSYIGKDTIAAVKEAEKSKSYYDASYASLLAQRDELKHQMDLEDQKKKSDSDKIADYKQEIKEIEDEIEYFANEMAKDLYDIDFKSWAQDLASTLVDAWAKGEDAADAYKKKVSEILRDLGVKMIAERFVSQALEPIMNEFIDQYKADDGVLTENGMAILGKMYDAGELLQQQTNDFMDGINKIAKERGLDMKEQTESSSASASIKGITEQTADILASYVNGVRADVSVIRAQEAISLPAIEASVQRVSVLAQTQVTHLQQIAANTQRNADAADKIYDILHLSQIGARRLQVNLYSGY